MRSPSAPSKSAAHPDWSQILTDAVNKPGVISTAYTAFWNYSTGNQLLAMFECMFRGIESGPIHTFKGWLKLDRHVRKGAARHTAQHLCRAVFIFCYMVTEIQRLKKGFPENVGSTGASH